MNPCKITLTMSLGSYVGAKKIYRCSEHQESFFAEAKPEKCPLGNLEDKLQEIMNKAEPEEHNDAA